GVMPILLSLDRCRCHVYVTLRDGERYTLLIEAGRDALPQIKAHVPVVLRRDPGANDEPHAIVSKIVHNDGERRVVKYAVVARCDLVQHLANASKVRSVVDGQKDIGAQDFHARIVDDTVILNLAVG